MRLNLRPSLFGCAVAGAALSSLPAAADWNNPYVHRETSGSWTNVQYDDGACRYYYSHNAYDNQTNLNKYGDCSRIAIGPDGMARPIYVVPPPYAAAPPAYGYGAAPPPYGR